MGAARFQTLAALVASVGLSACRGPDVGEDSQGNTEGEGDDGGGESGGFDPLVCGTWQHVGPGATNQLPADADPRFIDVTQAAGLSMRQYLPVSASEAECIFPAVNDNGLVPNRDCEPSWFTGGVSIGDVDGDGWEDLYVTRLAAPDALFINRGDGTFVDEAAERGIEGCTYTNGTLLADLDNDGDLDLVVTGMGGPRNYLYINDGSGNFSEQAEARGIALTVDGIHGGQGVTAGDYDRDGDLDLHINEWADFGQMSDGGDGTAPHGSRLLQNQGDATFVDVTEAANVSMELAHPRGIYGFSSAFVDLDDDGWDDLAVAADFGSAKLFWNEGDGTFSDGTEEADVAKESNAMGSAFGDVDGDGTLEWFVTSIYEVELCDDEPECGLEGNGNRLYRVTGDRVLSSVTDTYGVRDGGWGWGAAFGDFDNDADVDLWQVDGWPGRDLNGGFIHRTFPARLWLNDGQPMTEVAVPTGAGDTGQGRAALMFDFDHDGDLDLLAADHVTGPVLLENTGEVGNYLDLSLVGTSSNRDGRGAFVTVFVDEGGLPQVRQVGTRGQFLGEHSGPLHFGLGGTDAVARIEIRWPSGEVQELEAVAGNQRLIITEP